LLKAVFLDSAKIGMSALMPSEFPFSAFGLGRQPTVGAFIKSLSARSLPAARTPASDQAFLPCIETILSKGSLAERILRAAPEPARYPSVYARLCDCLEDDSSFLPD
jgi:hypothetical protein